MGDQDVDYAAVAATVKPISSEMDIAELDEALMQALERCMPLYDCITGAADARNLAVLWR